MLNSLEQLKENEAFQVFIAESKLAYDKAVETSLNACPHDLASFVARERMLGAAAETKRFLGLISSMEEDLNHKLTEHNAKRN